MGTCVCGVDLLKGQEALHQMKRLPRNRSGNTNAGGEYFQLFVNSFCCVFSVRWLCFQARWANVFGVPFSCATPNCPLGFFFRNRSDVIPAIPVIPVDLFVARWANSCSCRLSPMSIIMLV